MAAPDPRRVRGAAPLLSMHFSVQSLTFPRRLEQLPESGQCPCGFRPGDVMETPLPHPNVPAWKVHRLPWRFLLWTFSGLPSAQMFPERKPHLSDVGSAISSPRSAGGASSPPGAVGPPVGRARPGSSLLRKPLQSLRGRPLPSGRPSPQVSGQIPSTASKVTMELSLERWTGRVSSFGLREQGEHLP